MRVDFYYVVLKCQAEKHEVHFCSITLLHDITYFHKRRIFILQLSVKSLLMRADSSNILTDRYIFRKLHLRVLKTSTLPHLHALLSP